MTTAPTPNRRLIFIDIENLSGGPTLPDFDLAKSLWTSTGILRPRPGDLVIVGCNPGCALAVHRHLDIPYRLVTRRGPDGADRALLDAWQPSHIAQRFGEVVIASGDGIFTDFAATCAALGVSITVIAPKESLSKRLQLVAHRAITIATPQREAVPA